MFWCTEANILPCDILVAMGITALRLYEQLTEATDDKAKAKIIAEAFGQLEEQYPNLKDVTMQTQLRETELLLQKEIRQV